MNKELNLENLLNVLLGDTKDKDEIIQNIKKKVGN